MNLLVPLIIFASFHIAKADMNITVDDFDRTRITYNPPEQWEGVRDSKAVDRYLQTTTITVTQGAYATFNFSGAHTIYYMGYGANPDQAGMATIRVTLDGQVIDVPENINRDALAQQILFSRTGLDVNQSHVITVQKTSPSGDHGVNIDAFIYTVPDPPSTTSSTPATATPYFHAPMSRNTILGIVLGLVGACAFLGVLVFLYLRRRLYNRGNMYLPKTHPQAAPPSNSSNRRTPPPHASPWSNGLVGLPAQRHHRPTGQHVPSREKGGLTVHFVHLTPEMGANKVLNT